MQTIATSNAERLSVCVHEASHFIVLDAIFPALLVTSIEVFDEPTNDAKGIISYDPSDLVEDPVTWARMVVNHLAGYVGEKRLGFLDEIQLAEHAKNDFKKVDKAIRDWGLDRAKLMQSADRILAEKWGAVMLLASVLDRRGRVTGHDATLICHHAERGTHNFFKD